ncbi:MAG: hypothetical protein LBB16_02595 [Puniceicoccales bacterium]|nr:hypothetical protein [Puniceicoccales bacterium]
MRTDPRIIATESTEPDCKRALKLVSSLNTRFALADKADDSDDIILASSGKQKFSALLR